MRCSQKPLKMCGHVVGVGISNTCRHPASNPVCPRAREMHKLCRVLRGSSKALPSWAWQRVGAHVACGRWKVGVEGTESA